MTTVDRREQLRSADSAEKETGRLEAFSDGVFSIAMTLLVLELKIPTYAQLSPGGGPVSAEALLAFLGRQWPGYFAFVSSFFTILVMWVHHHSLFKLIRRVDAILLFTNGLLLLVVTAIPFPTAILAQYLMTPASRVACMVYSGSYVLVAACFYALLRAAFRPHLLSPHAPAHVVDKFRSGYNVGVPAYLLATLSALISPWLCVGICTGLWMFWLVFTIENQTDRTSRSFNAG